jgi:hypothetical protein
MKVFGKSKKTVIPVSRTLPTLEDNYTILWVGTGEAYVYENDGYVRSESNDYAFEVIQRRHGNNWKSIKNQHRIHPDYNGKAGPREQTMYFEIEFSQADGTLKSVLKSSLGDGSGISDKEFREQTLQFQAAGISAFAPYNQYRITQHYQYEEGLLVETVELFKLKEGAEKPFAKIEERATIFRPTKLEGAPTRFV